MGPARGNGLGVVDEDEVLDPPPGTYRRWAAEDEEESAIIPRTGMLGAGIGRDVMTDASSLRRRQSSSTIASYYDKSKLPLSISQQTSNSAMAKGLPAKASALLDINSEAMVKPKKKKPTMLDLSSLLAKTRSRHLSIPGKSLVLGPDMMTKSPSMLSASPDATPPPIQQRSPPKKVKKKRTKDRLREEAQQAIHAAMSRPRTQPSPAVSPDMHSTKHWIPQGARHNMTKSTANLHNLYEHYEQRTFQDVLDRELAGEPLEDLEPPPSIPPIPPVPRLDLASANNNNHNNNNNNNHATPPQTLSAQVFLAPETLPAASSRTTRSVYPSKAPSMMSVAEAPLTVTTSQPSLASLSVDCGASVSSRHTRTSKASKRTDRSITDLDLKMNSVLSLSSDSEDDFSDTPGRTSLSVPGSSLALSDGQSSPTSPSSTMARQPSLLESQDNRTKPVKRTSFAPPRQYLTIPDKKKAIKALKVNERTSSLPPSPHPPPTKAQPPIPIRSSVRTSTSSNLGPHTLPRDMRSLSTYESRTLPLPPPPGRSSRQGHMTPEPSNFTPERPTTSPNPRSSAFRQTADHPTPPISPTRADFYMAHGGQGISDNQSVRSGQSSTGSHRRRRSGSATSAPTYNSGRMMAVTRQEEMLLAALRMKRARMRESIIAEFEEEQMQEKGVTDEPLSSMARRPMLETRESSSTINTLMVSRQSSRSTVRLDPLGPGPQIRPSIESMTGSAKGSWPVHRGTPPRASSPGAHSVACSDGSEQGQILVMLDRPVESVDDLDTAEPSPDLSDFLDFDDGSEEYTSHSPTESSEMVHADRFGSMSGPVPGFRTARHRVPPAITTSKRTYGGSRDRGIPRRDSDSLSPHTMPRRGIPRDHDDPVRILEDSSVEHGSGDDSGVPRPDSPLAFETSMFPMPGNGGKKKDLKKTQVRLSAVGFQPLAEVGWWDDED
jgi:hypothetical protein